MFERTVPFNFALKVNIENGKTVSSSNGKQKEIGTEKC